MSSEAVSIFWTFRIFRSSEVQCRASNRAMPYACFSGWKSWKINGKHMNRDWPCLVVHCSWPWIPELNRFFTCVAGRLSTNPTSCESELRGQSETNGSSPARGRPKDPDPFLGIVVRTRVKYGQILDMIPGNKGVIGECPLCIESMLLFCTSWNPDALIVKMSSLFAR